uniref:Xin actin binding repeat containing 2 n=1 Tax=Sphenodon punctatus TaxID=8508 RepID=A0A8D0G951_SPHPU
KKQFEKGEIASSQNTFAQYQYQHKSVQKTHIYNTKMKHFCMQVSHLEQVSLETNKPSDFTQHIGETVANASVNEETPKVSAQSLKQHFERTAQEKARHSDRETVTPMKQIKIENEYQEMAWPSTASSSYVATASASRVQQTSATRKTEYGAAASSTAYTNSSKYGSIEELPPPPSPDLLQAPSEMTEHSQSPEPLTSPANLTAPKDLYSKQRSLYELKRLYKHIHPDLRKNLEKDYFNEICDIVSSDVEISSSVAGDVQQARYVFENTGNSPQKCMSPEREYLEWDEILKGEVQSMRWIFENQPLDSIKDESPDESNIKSIADQEIIAGGDVKYTTWMFETQPIDALGAHSSDSVESADKIPELARGDVRTATWMFETQSLDSMNKIHHDKELESDEFFLEEMTGGDVKTVRYMFETQDLDKCGQLYSVDEASLLQLRSELKEIKGDVKRSIKHFETQPMYVIRDNLGQILEIKTVHREDIEKGDVRTARWMFETQPLDMINKESVEIKVVRGVCMEESVKGGVSKAKWLFETQPLDTIKEESEVSVIEKETILGSDVCRKCWIFETQPLDTLKDNDDTNPLPSEEIIGGDVSTTKHLFETLPMDMLKDSPDVGRLQKLVATEEEKGDVMHQKLIFETKPLEQIREEKKEFIRTVKLEEIDRGDVSSCKHVFESSNLSKYDESHKIHVEGVTRGAVELNKALFETTPLYAIQDSFGKYHEVKTIRQEEVVRGDVRSCKWLFETRPLDQFDESINKIQIIKGISSQEVQSGDVKTAKWLFETQPLDSIKYFSNVEDEESKTDEEIEIVKGDVKMCRWLFETQPMESLYDKAKEVTDSQEVRKGDVKTCTWLFETQPLDAIKDESETTIKLHTVNQEEIQGSDVRTACFIFETENLENIQGEEDKEFRRVVEINIQPGDVSTLKYKFENQSLDSINFSSEEVVEKIKTIQREDIQKGDVLHCQWLFENNSIDAIKGNQENTTLTKTVTDIQGGNVRKGCFIFETFSLDQIKEESEDIGTKNTITEEEITKGDVKNYRMLFETQPFYAIQDKEGYYHEVTTVKKEEVIHGDVRGTRWLFETKPLGSINESDNVYVIKSVTQEDIQKGDVSSVRYRFETQPLDRISEDEKLIVPTVDSIQGGDVKASTQLFESERFNKGSYVRTVSVSEIQQGNVKTSTWLFETHTIDEIRGEGSEYKDVKMVTKEDVQKVDVEHAVWLFENQSLDSIKETDESDGQITREEIPQSDVKTTKWLFETTPFHEFNESKVEKEEIIGKSIKETLKELFSHKVVESHGIILEADEIGDVRMAKYKLMNQETPEIQKEEIIRGDLGSIMMNLLSKSSTMEKEIKINKDEKGNINLTKAQLLNKSTYVHVEKEEIVRGDIQQAIKNLFSEDHCVKRGILIQENERGDINMTVYSLLHKKDSNKTPRDEVIGGDVKRTIHNLLSSAVNNEISERAKLDDSERGNVQFFTTCIEAGALDYLKLLQTGSNETFTTKEQEEEKEIIGGDVEGTKLLLKKHKSEIQRTVNETDIVPGDVCNAVKMFMTEPQNTSCHACKEEIIKGNLKAALNSLSQSINQTTVTEKEEIIKADILATLKSLQEAAYQLRETEKPDVIPGDIKRATESLERAINTKNEVLKEEVVRGDLELTLRSLKEAQQTFKKVDKEDVIRGDIHATVQNLVDASAEKKTIQHKKSAYGDVKSSIQTLFESSQQLAQDQENMTGDLQKTVKSLHQCYEGMQEVEKENLFRKDVQDTKKIPLDQEQSSKSLKIDKKNLKSISNSQHKVTEKLDETVDKIRVKSNAKREAKNVIDQVATSQSAFHGKVKRDVRTEKSESGRTLKKDSTSTVVHSAEQIAENKLNLLNQQKDKEYFNMNSQKDTRQKTKLSTDAYSSKSRTTQPPFSESVSGMSKTTGHFQKQEVKQGRKQAQHSREVSEEKERSVKPVQAVVSMTAEQNIKHKQNIKVTQEMHSKFTEMDQKQKSDVLRLSKKSIEKFTGETKGEAAKSHFQLPVKNLQSPTKIPKDKEKPETDLLPPPPSPLPPPSSAASSEIEFPLPPPPPPTPLMMASDKQMFPPAIGKAKAEFDHFPPPPSPIDDKSESDFLPSLPLPPPPPPSPPVITHPKQKREHFPKYSEQSLPHSLQPQANAKTTAVKLARVPSSKKFPQMEPPKGLETNKTKMTQKTEVTLPQKHTETGITKTMEESTESTTMESKVSIEQKEKTTCTNTKEITRALCAAEAITLPPKTAQQIPPSKKRAMFPLVRSPSLPAETTQIKPKTYVRKFKTPLMIAEEKYRKQREEMEKMQAESFCFETARRNSEIVPADSEFQVNLQATGSRGDKQLSASLGVSLPAEQLQNILETSAEDHIRKKVLQGSKDLTKHNLSCQMEQINQKYTLHKTEELKNVEQLHVSKNKIISPSFKVKTIKLPTVDQSIYGTHKDSEIHKKQQGTNVQNVVKQQIQEKQKEDISTTVRKKQSLAKEHLQMHVDERVHIHKAPFKNGENIQEVKQKGSSQVKQKSVNEKETGKGESKEEGVSLAKELNQGQVLVHPEEKGIAQRKQEQVKNKSTEKVTKQKVIGICHDSQTQISEQEKTCVSKSNVQNKKLSQEYNSLQETDCILDKDIHLKQVPINKTEPKQEISQNKSLFSVSQHNDEKRAVNILEFLRKREELQQVLSRMKQFEAEPNKNDTKTFQTFLNIIPVWLIDQERKKNMCYIAIENKMEKIKEELSGIKAQASKMLTSCEDAIQKAMISTKTVTSRNDSVRHGDSSHKISKTSIGSHKKESQKIKEIVKEETLHDEIKQMQSPSPVSSPSLRMRSPSPTYITIESRRIEYPLRDTLFSPPVQRESTPVPPPPPPTTLRSATPTSKIQRTAASPSPPRSRSEQLAKLKDTTAKLSQGATQHQSGSPVPVVEKRSEIVKSPATLRRQIKIETHATESLSSTSLPVNGSHVTAGTVKNLKGTHGEDRKAERNKNYSRKEPVNIPENLEPQTESLESVSVTQKFEVPKVDHSGLVHRFEASEQVSHTKKKPVTVAERVSNESEDEIDIVFGQFENNPLFDMKSKKRVTERGESNNKTMQEKNKFIRNEFGRTSLENMEHSFEPMVCPEAKSYDEHSSGLDSFENTIVESSTSTSTAHGAEERQPGFGFKHAPPTYEDVISGHILDISAADSPEELLRNFQKTWQESERVFKSLGYAISDTSETEVRSSYHEEAAFLSGK